MGFWLKAKLLILGPAIILAFTGCGGSSPTLVGNWIEIYGSNNPNPSGGCHFYKDGTAVCSANGSSLNGTWKQLGRNRVRIGLGNATEVATYELHGNNLTVHFPPSDSSGTEKFVRH